VNRIPDDLKHPSGGERVTGTAGDAIRLAHKALERFPDVVKRHKFIAGGAAISSSLVALAGVAIVCRIRSGQSEEEALASVTEEELSGRRADLPGREPAGAHDVPSESPPETTSEGPQLAQLDDAGGKELQSIGDSEFDMPLDTPVEGDGLVPVQPRG
jgi:hypothetical protein